MVFDFLFVSLLFVFGLLGALIGCMLTFWMIFKGDTVAERVELLKDLGYEVEVENGTIFILLSEKDYNNRYFRKGIEEVMGDYTKSYGIRLKERENE